MIIRIHPEEIEIPEDEPFKHDLLNREEAAEVLTHLISSIEGPCVLAIDAAWGNGKSTFLRLWSQHLRNSKFPVIELNAWETDYAEDPFAVLSIELTDGLKQHAGKAVISDVVQGAIKVGRFLTPGMFRLALNCMPEGVLLGSEVSKLFESYGKARLLAYREARNSVKGFRDKLQTMAKEVSEGHLNKPVLVMIDELDRCRPSYAVELLEVAKHLFSVDRIIFVLAINRAELGHSIKSLYGKNFDANGYLKRFIDIDFVLPVSSRSEFISSLIYKTNIEKYFQRTADRVARKRGNSLVSDVLKGIFESSALSLRQISQAVHRIGLVLASLRSDRWTFELATVAVLILRTMDENLYRRFCMGNLTDLEVIDTMFPGEENGIFLGEFYRCLFEAAIILGYEEISGERSLLLRNYEKHDNLEMSDNGPNKFRQHAREVTYFVKRERNYSPPVEHLKVIQVS